MQEVNAVISLAKLAIGVPEVFFAGAIRNKDGIHMNTGKAEKLRLSATPVNKSQLRSLNGSLNYLRNHLSPNFVNEFFEKVSPYLKKDFPENFNQDTVEILETIIQTIPEALDNAIPLHPLDENRQLHLAADASDFGIGAILFHTLNLISKKLSQ